MSLPSGGLLPPGSQVSGPTDNVVLFLGKKGWGGSGITPRGKVGGCLPDMDQISAGVLSLEPHQQRGGSLGGVLDLAQGSQYHWQLQDQMAALGYQSTSKAGESINCLFLTINYQCTI